MVINTNYLCINPNNTGCRGRNATHDDYHYIVIHYVGACNWATGFESTAINNCIYYRDYNVGASANYYADSLGVCMSVPPLSDRYAWHCGTGKNGDPTDYYTDANGIMSNNPNSLGVEICTCKMDISSRRDRDLDWYFDPRTYKNAVELVRQLMKEYNIDIDHVIRHYDANPKKHKWCPSEFLGDEIKTYYGKTGEELWKQFKTDLVTDSKDVLQAYKVVSSDGTLNLRDKPGNDGNIIKVMKSNDYVLASKETEDGWVYVKYVSSNKVNEGWCFKKYLEKAVATQTREVDSPDGTLNIRAMASTKGKLIATMNNGYKFVVLSATKTWGLIQCGETLGYCSISDAYSKTVK